MKGSGRSTEEYDMFTELCKCQALFTKFGGHRQAAGVSLKEENVQRFRETINSLCTLTEEDLQMKVYIDMQGSFSVFNRRFDRAVSGDGTFRKRK